MDGDGDDGIEEEKKNFQPTNNICERIVIYNIGWKSLYSGHR
jgi:hypothetical protein